MTKTKTYPLRLPRSLKKAVEQQSKEDRPSINQFVATAVAEKLSATQTAEFFASRKARADFKAFDKLMRRRGGKRPRAGDELPPRYSFAPLSLIRSSPAHSQKTLPSWKNHFRWLESPTLPPIKNGPKAVSASRPAATSFGNSLPVVTPYIFPNS